jgi:cytochrome b involved in lipid metabolism
VTGKVYKVNIDKNEGGRTLIIKHAGEDNILPFEI